MCDRKDHYLRFVRQQFPWITFHPRLCSASFISTPRGSHLGVENSSRDWNTRPPYLRPEKSVCRSGSNRQQTGSKSGKEYVKAVYCHPDYLTYMQSFRSVHSLSHVWLFVTPCTAALQASLPITNSWSLPKLMSVELVMLSNHLILCHPLLLLPSIFPSNWLSNESVLCIRWPEC